MGDGHTSYILFNIIVGRFISGMIDVSLKKISWTFWPQGFESYMLISHDVQRAFSFIHFKVAVKLFGPEFVLTCVVQAFFTRHKDVLSKKGDSLWRGAGNTANATQAGTPARADWAVAPSAGTPELNDWCLRRVPKLQRTTAWVQRECCWPWSSTRWPW